MFRYHIICPSSLSPEDCGFGSCGTLLRALPLVEKVERRLARLARSSDSKFNSQATSLNISSIPQCGYVRRNKKCDMVRISSNTIWCWHNIIRPTRSLVPISFSCNNKNVSINTDCYRLSSTYSYISHGMRRLVSFMLFVLQASYGVRMVVQSFQTTRAILPSPKHI